MVGVGSYVNGEREGVDIEEEENLKEEDGKNKPCTGIVKGEQGLKEVN